MSLNTILATTPLVSTGYHLKATGTTIGNSLIWDNGTNVGIGNQGTTYTLDVSGTGRFTSDLTSLTIKSTYSGTTNWNSFGNQLFIGVNGANNNYLSDNMYYNGAWLFANAGAGAQIYFGASAAGSIDFITAPTGAAGGTPTITNRMTILQGGNVGIGTSSPSFQLDVQNTSATTPVRFLAGNEGLRLDTSSTAYDTSIRFYNNNSATYWGGIQAGPGAISGGGINIYGNGAYPMAFNVNGAERMRITSGGSVCINSSSPLDASAKLNVSGNVYLGATASGAGNSTLKYNTSTGLVSFDTSARIFKKDIIDLQYGLDTILEMKPKKYKWKSNNNEDLGFIADEMYEVVPEVVYLADNKINKTELKDGEAMGINYDRLVPVLVKAIQEMNTKLDEQNQTIQNLQEQINILAK